VEQLKSFWIEKGGPRAAEEAKHHPELWEQCATAQWQVDSSSRTAASAAVDDEQDRFGTVHDVVQDEAGVYTCPETGGEQ